MYKTTSINSIQSVELLKLFVNEADRFKQQNSYKALKDQLHQCSNVEQLFELFIDIGKQWKIQNVYDSSCSKDQRSKDTMLNSKISQSTSSSTKDRESQQLSLKQQIEAQQIKIEGLQRRVQQLKIHLLQTQKMLMINKKYYCQTYEKNMKEAVKMILQRQDQISQYKQNQQLLLERIKQRDLLIEQTLLLLQRRQFHDS